ncbi:MAG TPA: ATP-binding protein [Methylocystis sp.]|jgi:hypothetical protein
MREKKVQHKRLPLRNVQLLYALATRVMERGNGRQNIVLFYGPTGIGKTEAATHVRNMVDGVILTAKPTWSVRHLLKTLLAELGVPGARGTIATLEEMCVEFIAEAPERPLIIDEADKMAAKPDMLETLRSISDAARMPLILVGEEVLPMEVAKISRFDGRVLKRQPGVSCNQEDARQLVDYFAPGIEIDDACLEEIRQRNNRRPRLIVTACEEIIEHCRNYGLAKLDVETYRNMHFETKSPKYREDA